MIADNPYITQYPELMAGKTVLYCHGFASSGQSGTVTRLREVMPQAKVIAPDLPIHPIEAIALLRNICQQEKPDLIRVCGSDAHRPGDEGRAAVVLKERVTDSFAYKKAIEEGDYRLWCPEYDGIIKESGKHV